MIKGGKQEWLGWWGVEGGKWRQLYLNNNKECGKNLKIIKIKRTFRKYIGRT